MSYRKEIVDVSKYVKYTAYGELRKIFISKVKDTGVKRPSSGRLESVLDVSYNELASRVECVTICDTDSFDTIFVKKCKTRENTAYLCKLFDAYCEYKNLVLQLDRPTVLQVEKLTQCILDNVTEDLLSLS